MHRNRNLLLAVFVGAMFIVAVGGCSLFNNDKDKSSASGSDRVGSSHDGTAEDKDILAYDRNTIPRGAQLLAEGLDSKSVVAPANGNVFLWDEDRRTTIDARQLNKGQRFTIDPLNGKASIDGNPITLNRPMLPRNIHKIYFLANKG